MLNVQRLCDAAIMRRSSASIGAPVVTSYSILSSQHNVVVFPPYAIANRVLRELEYAQICARQSVLGAVPFQFVVPTAASLQMSHAPEHFSS